MKNYFRLFALMLCIGATLTSCRNEENKATDETEINRSDTIANDATMERRGMNTLENVDRDKDGELDEYDAKAAADNMDMDADAQTKVKDDKIKIEDSNKKVKIKTDGDGMVEKAKVKYKDEGEK